MNIFLAFNDGYVLPTKVMLRSLIINNPVELNIYILYCSLTPESIESIRKLEKENVHFFFMQVSDDLLPNVQFGERYPKEACFRLFAHEFFDEGISRVLWLDGDMIINGPLSDFYDRDFDGKLFIAVEDMELTDNEKLHKRLDMPKTAKYVNSGVLLLNLQGMRKEINEERIAALIKKKQDVLEFPDQDVLNAFFYDRIKVVDPKHYYNFFHGYITYTNRGRVLKNARIIHYVSLVKPWKKDYCFLGFDLWWKYALPLGEEYRSLYDEIKDSCVKARKKHIPIMVIKSYFPNTLRNIKKFIMKIGL